MKKTILLFYILHFSFYISSAQTWSAVGSGIDDLSGLVNCMTEYNGKLFIGGRFNKAGGIPVNGIASWDGNKWDSVDTGVSFDFGGNGEVLAMEVYNAELYVVGYFNSAGGTPVRSIARWNGIKWDSVGKGIQDRKSVV